MGPGTTLQSTPTFMYDVWSFMSPAIKDLIGSTVSLSHHGAFAVRAVQLLFFHRAAHNDVQSPGMRGRETTRAAGSGCPVCQSLRVQNNSTDRLRISRLLENSGKEIGSNVAAFNIGIRRRESSKVRREISVPAAGGMSVSDISRVYDTHNYKRFCMRLYLLTDTRYTPPNLWSQHNSYQPQRTSRCPQ